MRIKTKWNKFWEVLEIEHFKDPDQLGEMRPVERQIVLKKNYKSKDRNIALHELIHAMSEDYGLKLTEDQVFGLEESFTRFFRLNKKKAKKFFPI